MHKGLLHQSLKEMCRYQVRSLLVFLSIFIASVFVTLLLYTSDNISNALVNMVSVQVPEVNQVRIESGENSIPYEELGQYMRDTGALQMRIELKAPILEINVRMDGASHEGGHLFLYSGDNALVTEGEKRTSAFAHTEDYQKSGVFFSERFLLENGINTADVTDSVIALTMMDENGALCEIEITGTGVLPKDLQANMNVKEWYDVFIDSRLLTEKAQVPMSVASGVLEFESHEQARAAGVYFEERKYDVTLFDDNVLNMEAESLIYKKICQIMEGFVLLTIIVSVFLTLSISFEEHKMYYGMLKAIGYLNRDIFVLCMAQAMILGTLGAVFGYLFATLLGDNAINLILNAVVSGFGKNVGLDVTFDSMVCVRCIVAMLFSCGIGGIMPTLRMLRQTPMQLLNTMENE